VQLLVDKTLSERGYSTTGRLLTRLLHTLSDTYPLHGRYVNDDEWDSPGKLVPRKGAADRC
jgi:proteasome activator subunit 4